jgi:putative transposase
MKSYRFRLYPSKLQEKQLNTHLWLAKNLWNELLEHSKETYRSFDKFLARNSLQLMVKDSGLFSQTGQEIAHRVEDGIWRYVKLRKAGNTKVGFPRFKSIDRMRSLHYPQFGFSLDEKLKVNPFGELPIVRHREIKGKIKTLSLKREASGKWFACFAVEETPIIKASNGKPRVGIDLGLETLATLSDESKIKNPRLVRRHEEKVAFFSRQLSKKKKGSINRRKAKKRLAIEHEKLGNTRTDFLHKKTTNLVNSYSFIAMEDLASQELAEKNYGKSINDAGWGELASMLRYKAESAGCKVVFVNPEGTTKECCICGSMRDMPLSERTYLCDSCGNHMDRDLNAARNILKRATAGFAGSNASGDVPQGTSLKEEVHAFRRG